MPRKNDANTFASGSAFFLWAERLCDLVFVLTACAVYQSHVYLLAPVFILYRIFYEIGCEAVLFAVSGVTTYYRRRQDTRGIMMVHYIASVNALIGGVITGILILVLAGPIARLLLGTGAAAADISCMRNLLYCFSPYAAISWLISVYRGSEKGMKRQNDMLKSVEKEQILRGFLILLLASAGVAFFHAGGRTVFYLLVLSGPFSSAVILKQYLDESKGLHPVKGKEARVVLRRLHKAFGSYLGTVLSQNGWMLADLCAVGLFAHQLGLTAEEVLACGGVILPAGISILQLPLLVSFGTTAGVLPKVEAAYDQHRRDLVQQQVNNEFARVLTMTLPIAFFILFHPAAVWRALFHMSGSTYASAEAALGLEAALYCLSFETAYLLSAMHGGRSARSYQIFGLVTRAALMYPMVQKWNMNGIVYAGIVSFAVVLFLNTAKISNLTDISFEGISIKLVKVLIACLAMQGGTAALKYFGGISGTSSYYLKALGETALMAGAGALFYFMAGDILHLFPKHRRKKRT
jgi:O-antigen/teichoic acid export membrane protein